MSIVKHRGDYRYTPEECDVRSVDNLKQFREKRDEWLHWLEHDEHHSISNQISAMLWSDAVFRLINISRKYAHESGGGFSTQSEILARALDRGYVAEQIIALRKLMEPKATRPEKQVISLRRLIDEVKAHRDLLTREMFVCHDGLPFDDRDGIDDLPPPDENGIISAWVCTTGPRAFGMSSIQHRAFDRMMNKAPTVRSPDDRIGDRFFEEIETTLGTAPFDQFKRYANKLLLHAADVRSRGSGPLPGVTLDNVWSCHRAILMAANRISMAVGGANIDAIPTPQFDMLENWESAFAPGDAFAKMIEAWDQENDERESWCREAFGSTDK